MIGLKPCPFCGEQAKFYQTSHPKIDLNYAVFPFEIRCHKCGGKKDGTNGKLSVKLASNGNLIFYDDERETAALKWNERGII